MNNNKTKSKILVIAPSWVGDMMMAHSLFQQIHSDNPDAEIGVVAPNWSTPLLARMPEVTEVFTLPVGHNRLGMIARWKLAKKIQSKSYQQAIILPRSYKSALIPFLAKIPERISFIGEMRYGLINRIVPLDKTLLPKTVDRFVYLYRYYMHHFTKSVEAKNPKIALDVMAPKLHVDKAQALLVLQKYAINGDKPILAICPGAEFGPSKQWPSERYQAIVQNYLDNAYQVVVLGSPNDAATGDAICSGINNEKLHNLINKTSLTEAVDILSLCDKVLTNDSGLMHIASALGRPLVAIYGSTSAEMTPPLSETALIVEKSVHCRPCFQRQCPLKDASEHHQCMKKISVDDILQAMS